MTTYATDTKPTSSFTGDSESNLALVGTPIGLLLTLTYFLAGESYSVDSKSSTSYSNDSK